MIGSLIAIFIVGIFIGTTGVGGVVIAPLLVGYFHLEAHVAAATALFTFVFAGCAGTLLYYRSGLLTIRAVLPCCLFAAVGSGIGIASSLVLSAKAIIGMSALTNVWAGLGVLVKAPDPQIQPRELSHHPSMLATVGVVSGIGAGLTGTGGPVFSVPLMLVLGFSPVVAMGTGQILQLFAATSGSLFAYSAGRIDIKLGLIIAVVEMVGVAAGVKSSRFLSPALIRVCVGVLCLLTGLFALAKLHPRFAQTI
jgi:uncharacterized membrane protein YfcA